MAERYLPYARQSIDDDDIAAVVAVLRADRLTTGPKVGEFEAGFARAVDAPHAVACSSGTAALHLAALALDLAPGAAVVVPAITFLATANAARFVGAEVVFADVDPETGLMGAAELERALARSAGAKVCAVFPVHLAGQVADMEAIAIVAKARGLSVVEDACHALGAEYGDGHRVGACRHADMAAFSFHPVKAIAMGEGGAVTTRDAAIAERLAALRSHGMTRDASQFENRDLAFAADGAVNAWYYEMTEPGFNYRASDIHCALGTSQLAKLAQFVAQRRRLMQRYRDRLAPYEPAVRMVETRPDVAPAWHLAVALIDFVAIGCTRADLMRALDAQGIGTQVHYIPVHLQPYYRRRYGIAELPGALRYYQRCLSLPLFIGMSTADVDRVVDTLVQVLGLPAAVTPVASVPARGRR